MDLKAQNAKMLQRLHLQSEIIDSLIEFLQEDDENIATREATDRLEAIFRGPAQKRVII